MQIPDYEMIHPCGRGAFGEVWIARNRAGTPVALKIIAKSDQIARELAGLRGYSRISDSPHLIRIFHIGECGGTLYYTMELADRVDGSADYIPATLSELLKRRQRLSPTETIELGLKLLSGLDALHRAGLVHRDVKPENILFVKNEPKLSDIGLVRPVSQSLSLGGTLGFVPPERLQSGSGGKTGADDLFALGKVLYCCLTGNPVEKFPSFPVAPEGEAASRLNRAILTACNRRAPLRFHNAAEFQAALRLGLSNRKRLLAFLYRFRYAAIVLLLALFAGGTWRAIGPRTDEPPEKPIELGEIQHRTYLELEVSGGDPDMTITQSDYEDPIFRKYSPGRLDVAPRRAEKVLSRFNGSHWESIRSRNIWQDGDTLRLLQNAEGGVRLMTALDYAYAIRFEMDYANLEDRLTFQVAMLNARGRERAFYQWTLRKTGGNLTLEPLLYQPENNGAPIRIRPQRQPADTPGFHKVEMLQTAAIFRLYIDDQLVLYAPSFFAGGCFTIQSWGGNSNFVELKNFELLKIPHDPRCPPAEQYHLPGTPPAP